MVLKVIHYDYSKFKNNKTIEDKFKVDIDFVGVFLILKGDVCSYVGYSENTVYNRFYVDGDKATMMQHLSKGNKIKIILVDKDMVSIRAALQCEHGVTKTK